MACGPFVIFLEVACGCISMQMYTYTPTPAPPLLQVAGDSKVSAYQSLPMDKCNQLATQSIGISQSFAMQAHCLCKFVAYGEGRDSARRLHRLIAARLLRRTTTGRLHLCIGCSCKWLSVPRGTKLSLSPCLPYTVKGWLGGAAHSLTRIR